MRKSKKTALSSSSDRPVFGSKLSFAASEAYKLLRTNLMFSLPETDKSCRIIGVTSAMRGEGKSTTSINISFSLAEAGKRVLLLDADMRLPKIAKTLNLKSSPGLSNVLTGMSKGAIPIQKCDSPSQIFVISSGDIPPNPSELLGAKSMEKVISTFTENFDYIIIDLPPVNIVTDALVITPLCDGILFVVRENYSSIRDVNHAVEQLVYCKAKILGYVLNDAVTSSKKYYKGKYYKNKYYNKYYSKYYSSSEYGQKAYEDAAKKENQEQ